MWRSKQAEPETATFSPTLSVTSTITPPILTDSVRRARTAEPTTTSFGPDTQMGGKISGNEDLRIDGPVEEPISLKCARLTVGQTAKVTVKLVAREVVVYGELFGNLQVRDRIEIKKNGSIIGNLMTARILIEDGAYFKGNLEIERRKTPRVSPQKRM